MKSTHLLAALFGITSALLDLTVATRFEIGCSTPIMLFLGLALGQLALLAFWCVLAGRDWLPRIAVLLAAAVFLGRPLSGITAAGWAQWSSLLGVFATCVAAPILLARCIGVGPFRVHRDGKPHPRRRFRLPARYSLSSLLSVMSLVAVILGLNRHVAVPVQHPLVMASYGFWLSLVAITALWSLHSGQALSVRLVLLSALCSAAGLFMARTEYQHNIWFFTMVALIEAITICGGFAVLEIAREVPRHAAAGMDSQCHATP